jgi:hypothetical protein
MLVPIMAKKTVYLLFALAMGAATVRAQRAHPPAWLGSEPLIIAGNWDDMPIFRLRLGGAPPDLRERYAQQHTEEAVRKLKDLGVTMGVIHFYKGFGLKAEAEHMQDARKLAALLKKNGMRVGVYVGSTVVHETFLAETPEAREWFVPDFLGRPVMYPNQTFRKRVYFMHPGYREYMKRVLKIALTEFQADLIHFDNTSMQAQPAVFHHPLAVRDFREYLARKYTAEERKARYGYAETRFVEPPAIDQAMSAINDPLLQDWADFRCHQLTAYYAEMEGYIRSIKPDAAVESNPHAGISGQNTVWEQGVDYPRLLRHMDVVWSEEGNRAQVTPEGILISKIRSYKMAETLGNRIFTYTGGGAGGKLEMAEAMAFNRETVGQVGDFLAGYSFPEDQRSYPRFFHQNFAAVYRGARSRADVAVLHSFESMAFNNDLPWQSSMLVQQALIQAHVPFDIIFDDQLAELAKYRALVLPDQECLTDEQIGLIRRYVEGGGGLVATENTSLFDARRRRRMNFGLSEVLGVTAPPFRPEIYTFLPLPEPPPGAALEEARNKHAAPVRRTVGRGRASYLASVIPVVEKPRGAPMSSRYWKLPANWREVVEEVVWAAGGTRLKVKAPPTLVVETKQQQGTERLLAHLVNYDGGRGAAENIEVAIQLPQGKRVSGARLLSPDFEPGQSIHATLEDGFACFRIPVVRTYSVVAVDLN